MSKNNLYSSVTGLKLRHNIIWTLGGAQNNIPI